MIKANDLKTKGIACLEESLADKAQDFIAASEKQCFVVMTLEQYYYLREMEMQAALYQVKLDTSYGRRMNNVVDQYVDSL
ncbi:MAG: type II toxin-antitoxin system Phd/YefM family antitoxin [Nitrosomonas sp. PRO4]|nr:type II toxin-antitoxin system Phd/YefM family antitoxin [Nitrosomonas sp. PRO4]